MNSNFLIENFYYHVLRRKWSNFFLPVFIYILHLDLSYRYPDYDSFLEYIFSPPASVLITLSFLSLFFILANFNRFFNIIKYERINEKAQGRIAEIGTEVWDDTRNLIIEYQFVLKDLTVVSSQITVKNIRWRSIYYQLKVNDKIEIVYDKNKPEINYFVFNNTWHKGHACKPIPEDRYSGLANVKGFRNKALWLLHDMGQPKPGAEVKKIKIPFTKHTIDYWKE